MNNLNSYVLTVCFVIVFCVAFEILTPNKKYRYIMRIVSGIFILNTLFSPLSKLLSTDFDNFHLTSDLSDEINKNYLYYEDKAKTNFDKAVYDSASETVKKEIECYLSDEIKSKAEVKASVDENGVNISISGVPEDKKEIIRNYIKSSFNTEPVITE